MRSAGAGSRGSALVGVGLATAGGLLFLTLLWVALPASAPTPSLPEQPQVATRIVHPVGGGIQGVTAGDPGPDHALAPRSRRQLLTTDTARQDADAAWALEPIASRDVVADLVHRPHLASRVPIVRSVTFNPRDERLAVSARDEVSAIVLATVEAAAVAHERFDATREREFALARSQGLAAALDLSNGRGSLALQSLGRRPFCLAVDGGYYGVARKDMPAAVEAQLALQQLGVELVVELAAVCVGAGVLTAAEQLELVARARRVAAAPR